jgi:hypothetical protein
MGRGGSNLAKRVLVPNTSRNDKLDTCHLDTTWTSDLLIKEGEVIYDMCWYPAMNSQDPASCCVLSSSRDHPVHLWDAYTGEVGQFMEKERKRNRLNKNMSLIQGFHCGSMSVALLVYSRRSLRGQSSPYRTLLQLGWIKVRFFPLGSSLVAHHLVANYGRQL